MAGPELTETLLELYRALGFDQARSEPDYFGEGEAASRAASKIDGLILRRSSPRPTLAAFYTHIVQK